MDLYHSSSSAIFHSLCYHCHKWANRMSLIILKHKYTCSSILTWDIKYLTAHYNIWVLNKKKRGKKNQKEKIWVFSKTIQFLLFSTWRINHLYIILFPEFYSYMVSIPKSEKTSNENNVSSK